MQAISEKLNNEIQLDFNEFKKDFIDLITNSIDNKLIKDIFLKNYKNYEKPLKIHHNNEIKLNFDKSKYIEVELYNISGKEYMIDVENGIVFSGKRADIVEILSKDIIQKLKLEHTY